MTATFMNTSTMSATSDTGIPASSDTRENNNYTVEVTNTAPRRKCVLLAFFWAALRLMPLSRELLLVIPNTEEGKP